MSPTKTHTEWLEIPIFIHGISPDENPPDHIAEYESLRSLVNKHLEAIGLPKTGRSQKSTFSGKCHP